MEGPQNQQGMPQKAKHAHSEDISTQCDPLGIHGQ